MTNMQIIVDSAIAEGIYTEEEVEAIFAAGNMLPLHTFAEWRRLGYQVRKGEHAALSCDIWRHNDKKGEMTMQDGSTREIDESHFYKKRAHFFLPDQVEKIAPTN